MVNKAKAKQTDHKIMPEIEPYGPIKIAQYLSINFPKKNIFLAFKSQFFCTPQ